MKASAKPLQIHSHCLILNPKLTSQNQFQSKSVQKWLPLYRVKSNLQVQIILFVKWEQISHNVFTEYD